MDSDVAGWSGAHDGALGVRKGALVFRSVGGDPYVVAPLEPPLDGPLVLTLRARTRTPGRGQLFWAEVGADFSAERAVDLRIDADGAWREATVEIPARRVSALRLDPFDGPGEIEILWLRLERRGKTVHSWRFDRLPDREPAGALPAETWKFLDNGRLRLGVKVSSGAALGWLSQSGSERNLLNHFDKGRLVQQSYYGDSDGSVWGKQPWRWNPVQGGDYKGNPAKVLVLRAGKSDLYAKTVGRNWAGCTDLPEAIFEEWIRLDGEVAHVRYRLTYSGTHAHEKRDHEIPAVFVEPDLDTLVVEEDGKLVRSKPGWPNEGRKIPQHWAAYVDAKGFGVGALVPVAETLTCYRFGDGVASHGACSYFAPLTQFAIVPGTVFTYDLYLSVGDIDALRARFRAIRTPAPGERGVLKRSTPFAKPEGVALSGAGGGPKGAGGGQ